MHCTLSRNTKYKTGEVIAKDSVVIVSSTGKLRTSGKVTVDSIKYTITKVKNSDGTYTWGVYQDPKDNK